MTLAEPRGASVILATLFAALFLTVLPLPDWAQPYRPEWYTLTLIYWCMALPHRVGVGVGWLLGILVDILTGSLLGQHALGLALIAYLTLKLHRRTRLFPLWQQALTVLMLLVLKQLLMLWITGITGSPPQTLLYWAPAVVGTLLWPWVFVVLRDIRRRFSVS